jgi:hypothetical protein
MGANFFLVRGCLFVYLYLGKLFLSARRRIHIKKRPFFYLCIRKILFVAQIIPPRGTFICAHIVIYEYTDAKKIAFSPPDNRKNPT